MALTLEDRLRAVVVLVCLSLVALTLEAKAKDVAVRAFRIRLARTLESRFKEVVVLTFLILLAKTELPKEKDADVAIPPATAASNAQSFQTASFALFVAATLTNLRGFAPLPLPLPLPSQAERSGKSPCPAIIPAFRYTARQSWLQPLC